MKTTVSNYIYTNYNERGLKAFENRVSKLLNDNNISGKIICHNAYMKREGGRGSYSNVIEIEINNEIKIFKDYHNNSELWDNWENPTAKEKRSLFLAVLEDKIKEIKDFINDKDYFENEN